MQDDLQARPVTDRVEAAMQLRPAHERNEDKGKIRNEFVCVLLGPRDEHLLA